jgi:hypothetical protein
MRATSCESAKLKAAGTTSANSRLSNLREQPFQDLNTGRLRQIARYAAFPHEPDPRLQGSWDLTEKQQ